jgi:hypothetical protein
MWRGIALGLIFMAAAAPAQADPESCAAFRKNILEMENISVRPPGWAEMDQQLRLLYGLHCVAAPSRKPEAEYWYRADGTPLGIAAGYAPPGWENQPPPPEVPPEMRARWKPPGYVPEGGAYMTTPEIAAFCAKTLNPSLCAMAKGVEAACRRPIDTQQRTQCAALLGGQVPDLPAASEPLPPIADLFGPARSGAPQMTNPQIWADPGFQRMCEAARTNQQQCIDRFAKISSVGTPSGPITASTPSDSQRGAFADCTRLYGSVYGMCQSTRSAALAAPAQPVAPPPPKPPAQPQAKPEPGRSMPPPSPAPPTSPPMSAKCQKLVGDYVKASEANDGPRALAGYNALKAEGGCNVLDKVDRGPPPAAPAQAFPSRRGTPLTDSYVQPCAADQAGCAQAMRQLEQGTSPEAKAALTMHAISTGLQLGAAIANGMAAMQPQGGGGGGGTNYNSIGNRPAARTYGQGAPTGVPQRNTPSDITGTK